MIKCVFCSNTKAAKYLFTECQHLVCLNCASLRINQGVKCCNKITHVDNNVKQELMVKKCQILRNLQNSYEVDVEPQQKQLQNKHLDNSYENLPTSISKQKPNYLSSKRSNKNQYLIRQQIQQQQDNEKYLESTPIDKFYPLDRQNSNQNSKQIYQMDEYVLETNRNRSNSNSNSHSRSRSLSPKQKYTFLKQKVQNEKVNSPIKYLQQKNQHIFKQTTNTNNLYLQEILSKKIEHVRGEFKILKKQLQKKEQSIIRELQKMFVQKIVNMNMDLNQKQSVSMPNHLLQRQKIGLSLQGLLSKYAFKEMRESIVRFGEKSRVSQTHTYIKSDYKANFNENFYGLMDLKNIEEFKPDYKDIGNFAKNQQQFCFNSNSPKKVKISQNPLSIRSPNIKIRGESSSRKAKQLQNIYKKLDESRSKLEERIQKHNIFLNQRYKDRIY